MAGHENNLDRVFENYIESLDTDNENLKILMELENASKFCADAKRYYEEARLNQYLYYKRLSSMKESTIVDNLVSAFKEKNAQHTKNNNIWRYFNELMKSKGISWKQILLNIKMNTKLADYFKKEEMNLYRISPEKLVAITNLLEGDPNTVLQLAYKYLVEIKKTRPSTSAISYREVKDVFEDNGYSITQTDYEQKEIIKYIDELKKAFH
jgi:hypothetical protein